MFFFGKTQIGDNRMATDNPSEGSLNVMSSFMHIYHTQPPYSFVYRLEGAKGVKVDVSKLTEDKQKTVFYKAVALYREDPVHPRVKDGCLACWAKNFFLKVREKKGNMEDLELPNGCCVLTTCYINVFYRALLNNLVEEMKKG